MLGVLEESQENTEILRRHQAHGRFWLLRKDHTGETPTISAFGHHHTGAFNYGEKMKICEKHQTLRVIA